MNPGDRVEYVGERLHHGPGLDDWLEPGDQGTLVDLEPPDDAPVVIFDNVGGLVLQPSDVRLIQEERTL